MPEVLFPGLSAANAKYNALPALICSSIASYLQAENTIEAYISKGFGLEVILYGLLTIGSIGIVVYSAKYIYKNWGDTGDYDPFNLKIKL